MAEIITLTTDFGLKDPYQGAMKGAILSINPGACLVDITHLVSPGNILEGAFILFEAYGFFPEGTIHVGVVDPGVGGKRMPLLIQTRRHFFIGPDNGFFSLLAEKEEVIRVINLTKKEFFLKEVSPTFHGRDIFAPVAAHLSLGADPSELGEEVKDYLRIELPRTEREGGVLKGEVIHIDSFGNLITNIRGEELKNYGGPLEVSLRGFNVGGVKKTYCTVEKGSPVALIGSSGFLEVAVNSGSAAGVTGASTGCPVTVEAVKI